MSVCQTKRCRTCHQKTDVIFNSLAPGRFQFNIRKLIFKQGLVNGTWDITYEIVLRWMPLDLTDDKSTVVQVMAWCRQATNHYLSQCWPRSISPNGVTRPQWVNKSALDLISNLQPCDSCITMVRPLKYGKYIFVFKTHVQKCINSSWSCVTYRAYFY